MPSGSKLPDVSIYNKAQGGELSADSALRSNIRIAAVSAGISLGGGGTVTIGAVSAGIVNALPVSLRGGTTNQDVKIAAITSGLSLPVTVDSNTCAYANGAYATTGSGSYTIKAGEANTYFEIRGFSICNESANMRRFELKVGNTAIATISLGAYGAPFNWNFVNGCVKWGVKNRAISMSISDAGTFTGTVLFKRSA